MEKELLKRALEIQEDSKLRIAKDEKDYAFTFIYPPSQVLYSLNVCPYTKKEIKMANLYIHIPYCTGRCSYCYFGCYSISEAPIAKSMYVEMLCKEMEMIYELCGRIRILSIHFGGGTPTTLSEVEITNIFVAIRKYFYVEEDIEITFESSPETLTKQKLAHLIDHGVNRLNIGIQTLNDDLLHTINRRHNAQMALEKISLAQDIGITNINVDVMYGLQGQSIEDWISTLEAIFKRNVQSISTYRLRIHPKGKISSQIETFDERKAIEMYIEMMYIMEQHGYFQCSSHKFAIKEEFAQKQIINKRGIDKNMLIPLGMAAYGYVDNVLFWNERTMNSYVKKINQREMPYSIGYMLDKTEEIAKTCVLGIHNVGGINLEKFEKRFGEKIEERYGSLIQNLSKNGLLENTNGNLRPSKLGMVFADEIAVQFYSEQIKKKLGIDKRYGIFFEHIL